jgi:tripartite-type tricarboxylate transporter receptor subunit TctC
MKTVSSLFLGLSACLFLAPCQAADWPTRPVRVVSPYAAGGASDTVARVVAEQISEDLHQQFFIENRAGAGGLIGAAAVANAKPDGYTFVVSSIGTLVTAPATQPNPGFDPLRSFSHVAYIGGPANVLVVHPSVPVTTFNDFLAKARSSRDPMTYVSPGPGTLGNLLAELLAQKEGIGLTHVSYKGGSQGMTDLIAGHVTVGCLSWSTALPYMQSGAVVPLAVSSNKRMPEFPDLPTLKELGHADLVAITWFSLSGPHGLPTPIVETLNKATANALAAPNVRSRLDAEGVQTEKMSPEEFTQFVESELAKWGPVAKSVMNAATPQ